MPSSPTTSIPSAAYPGLTLGPSSIYASGPGTHIHGGQITASLIGKPTILPSSPPSKSSESRAKPIITIPRLLPSPFYAPTPSPYISNTNVLPSVGSLVLARVLRVRPRQVDLGILCVASPQSGPSASPSKPNNTSSQTPSSEQPTTTYSHDSTIYHVNASAYPLTLRREDVRATEKDKVVTSDCFRVGDVVRAELISLGDAAGYYCHTGRNELGVLVAWSERTGEVMAPMSWREFVEVGDGDGGPRTEVRKVAKPF